jgi:lipid-A-disaccharide synthase
VMCFLLLFQASDVSLCTSGTAVLQLQMARVPTVVAYRAHPLTEWLIKSRTKLHYISLPNILLDSPVIPEALFADCTPKRLFTLLRYTTCLFSHVHGLDQTSFEQVVRCIRSGVSGN